MPTLRITQSDQVDGYRAHLDLVSSPPCHLSADVDFQFNVTAQDQEDFRWYLEDYLQYPQEPARSIAARIETRMKTLGEELFTRIFSTDQSKRIWDLAGAKPGDLRVEIATSLRGAISIPWELLRNPGTGIALALQCKSFVRASNQIATDQARDKDKTIRILLVICRPSLGQDVPFRSVASRLIEALHENGQYGFELHVLRPPTFKALADQLRQAKEKGQGYQIVHFDGHGTYADLKGSLKPSELMQSTAAPPLLGSHGYLLFENPKLRGNSFYVAGAPLAELLVETGVQVLMLNACRSAHADAQAIPVSMANTGNGNSSVRAFGSFAQEIVSLGVPGVVAMRYNVYVVTAASFVFEFYAALARGASLSDGASAARKALASDKLREIGFDPVPLDDWMVPVVYADSNLTLTAFEPGAAPTINLKGLVGRHGRTPDMGDAPRMPDSGFFGRDETILALDRSFDTQSVVLLHAWAGSGKTATAMEFARWYWSTGGLTGNGGIQGHVIFTSFEQHKTLSRVLDQIGHRFAQLIQANGYNWLAMDFEERRAVALAILEKVPVLWIWDNIEPINGFPKGSPSQWTAQEQQELLDFLRDAAAAGGRFLLTSRRDERDWLGDIPARLTMPPMPMLERVQLTRALAQKSGARLIDVEDWRPLLSFTQGNPLTITVLVTQALRDKCKTKQQVEQFVKELQAGEAAFSDESSEGRSKSLGASLSYGFQHAFNEAERRQLAVLHLFQGFIDAGSLYFMGHKNNFSPLPELKMQAVQQADQLLNRAAETGILTAFGGMFFTIHPAVPWFLRSLFEKFYPDPRPAKLAFADAIAKRGNFLANKYGEGETDIIPELTEQEPNLRAAMTMAVENQWMEQLSLVLVGFRCLYLHTSRARELKALLDSVLPLFADPATDLPLPGREAHWSTFTDGRVRAALHLGDFAGAERLQRLCLQWDRDRTAPILEKLEHKKQLQDEDVHEVNRLALSYQLLADILRDQGKSECVEMYRESIRLQRDREQKGFALFHLGNAYVSIPDVLDLDAAERCCKEALGLVVAAYTYAACLGLMGRIEYERFLTDRRQGKPGKDLIDLLKKAEKYFLGALQRLPADALADLGASHNMLGIIYGEITGLQEQAKAQYQDAIRYYEQARMTAEARSVRYNMARLLVENNKLNDAYEFAKAGLRDAARAEDQNLFLELIQDIQQKMLLGG